MENASKALLFAAGILIAIILISVAVYLVNMSQDATKNVGSAMTEMQLMQFNQQFTTYEGIRTGSQIKQLVNKVNTSNADNAGTDMIVNFEGTDSSIIDGSADAGFNFKGGSAKKYNVKITTEDGAVKTIVITGTTSSTT